LFAEAQRLMDTKSPEDAERARNGPIRDYLYYYGDRTDAQSKQMQDWGDRYDIALREQQLDNRYRLKLPPEGKAESQARRALRGEEVGDWGAANEHWKEAAKFKADVDPDLRLWGLVAQKRIDDLATAAVLEQELPELLREHSFNRDLLKSKALAVRSAQEFRPDWEMVEQAVKASRYELFGDLSAARANWQTLRDRCEKEMEQRPLFLLAAKRLQEPRMRARATKEEENRVRLQCIKHHLDESRKLVTEKPLEHREAGLICAEILDLYHHFPDFRDDPNPDLKQLVEQAQQLAEQLSENPEQKR
jgi:hypothetical protein